MHKDDIIKNIESGLLAFYLDKDQELFTAASKESGIDVIRDKVRYEYFSKQLLTKARAKANQERFAKLLSIAKAKSKIEKLANSSSEALINIFNKYIREHGLVVNYRKLEDMNEEEIKEILKQIDLTDLINDIDSALGNE